MSLSTLSGKKYIKIIQARELPRNGLGSASLVAAVDTLRAIFIIVKIVITLVGDILFII